MQSNPNIQQLLSFFPKNYATFEVVILIRIFYFLCFNIISSASLVYVVDEAKECAEMAKKVQEKVPLAEKALKESVADAKVVKDKDFLAA